MISWSFSRLADFEACPLKFKLKYLDKVETTSSAQASRGTDLHNQIENFITGKTDEYPCLYLVDEITILKTYNPIVEEQWGFDQNWNPCDWFKAWLRMIPDAYYIFADHLTIIDLKSGKQSPIKHTAQLQLFSIGGFYKFPQIQSITTKILYIDNGDILSNTYNRVALPTLQKGWLQRVERLTNTRIWNPKPSKWNCKYCDVKAHCDFEYTQ